MLEVREVVNDVGMAEIEPPGRGIVAIALFGNRQRHDARGGGGETCTHLVPLVAQKQHLADAADHTAPNARGAFFHGCVQRALRHQAIADIRRAQTDATNAPVAWFACQRVIGVYGALRTIERADTDVNDADTDAAELIGRSGNARREAAQRCRRQPDHAGCGCSLTRDTSCVGLTKRSAISSHVSVTSMYTIAMASTDCGARTPAANTA